MKAFIFDLDGVIVFTDQFHFQAWKQLADSLGIYFDEKINHRLRGVSRMDSLEIILEKSEVSYSEQEKLKFAEKKNDRYRELLKTMKPSDISEDVKETIKALKEQGHKLAIGSSSKNTKFILKQTGLYDWFDAISDGTNITRSKPDPEVFVKAAQMLGEKPENCIVVEDACAGIDAAKAGNMTAVGIGDAAAYQKTDYPIDKFTDLLGIAKN